MPDYVDEILSTTTNKKSLFSLPVATAPFNTGEQTVIMQGGTVKRGNVSDIAGAISALSASFILIGADANLANERYLAAGTGVTISDGGAGNAVTINLDATLAALSAYNTNGILTQTAADTFVGRTIVAGTGITVSNGNGVSGNPTIDCTITQYTDEMAQDAIGAMAVDTATVNVTYTDGTPELKWDVIANTSIQKVEVTKNSGAVVGTRKQLNFIEGSGVTLTIADDAGNDQVDITIAASGGAGTGDVVGPASATDNALVRFDSTTGKLIQNSGAILDDSNNLSGVASITLNTAGALRTATSDTNTLLIQARDVDGAAYTTFITLTAGNTPTCDLADSVTKGGNYIYRAGGTDVPLTDGGTGASTAADARTNLGVVIGTNVQAWDATLDAFAAYNTNGLLTQTAADTFTGRTITGTANQISVSNGNGVSGNPTLSTPQDIHTGASPTFANVTLGTAGALRTSQSDTNTLLLQAYDVDGAAYTTFATLTAGNTPTFSITNVTLTALNTGLKALDTNASHSLIFKPGSDLTAERTFTITTGDANRTLTLSADATISGTNTGDQTITLTGDVTGSGTGSFAATIADDAVTYAKMQNISATSRILGRKTAAAGNTEECTLSEVLDFVGSAAQGDILYRGAATWTRLGAGTSGQFLKTQGAGANPIWDTVSGTGDVVGPASATDNALVRFDSTTGKLIQNSGVIVDDSNNVSGAASLTLDNGGALRTTTTAAHTLLIQARDVDGAAYTTFITLTANNTPTCDLDDAVTKAGQYIYRVGGTDVAVADGGTGSGTAAGARTNLGLVIGTDVFTQRTITGTANQISVSNGDGVSGNPTLSTPQDIHTGASPTFANITLTTGGALRTNTSAGNTLLLQARDVDGAAYTTFITLTANNTPTCDLDDAVTKGGQYIYRGGGTDVPVADGGTGASTASGARTNLGLVIGTDVFTQRTLTGTANQISISNGDGTGGNPTFSTPQDIHTGASPTFANLNLATGGALRSATSAGNTLLIQARDVDGAAYTTFITLTANNTPTCDLDDAVTKAGQYIYRAGGTDVPVTDGGTGASTASGARTNLGLVIGTDVAAAGANTDLTSVYLNNTGLKVKDTNASHGLTFKPGSDLTADKTLTVTTGDADRTLTFSGDATISGTNTGDQNLFGTIAVSGQSNVVADTTSDTLTLVAGSNITITTNATTDEITITASLTGGGYTTVKEEGTSLTQRADLNFIGTGITAADNAGSARTDVTLASILNAITDLASNGLIARTGAGTVAARSIAVGTGLSVSNADGASGNPTVSLAGGKQTIWVPAAAMYGSTTSGATAAQIEMATNKNQRKVLTFVDASDTYAHFTVTFPKSWNEGTVTAIFYWTANSTSTNSVVWGLQAVALSDNDAIDVAFGTAQTVTDANGASVYTERVSAESSAITIAGTPAEGDEVEFRVYRDGDNGSDNLAVDALLLGVKLLFTTNAGTDD